MEDDDTPSQEIARDYAQAAQSKAVPAALFALRYSKAKSAREFFAKANIAPLIAWLGLRGERSGEEEATQDDT